MDVASRVSSRTTSSHLQEFAPTCDDVVSAPHGVSPTSSGRRCRLGNRRQKGSVKFRYGL
jgi:hypothetical protein